MEKDSCSIQMVHIMWDTLVKAMLIRRADLLVPMGGFMKVIWRMSKQKAKEFFIIEDLSINLKEHGLEIYQMVMGAKSGYLKIFPTKVNFSMVRSMVKENILLHNLNIKDCLTMMNLTHMVTFIMQMEKNMRETSKKERKMAKGLILGQTDLIIKAFIRMI